MATTANAVSLVVMSTDSTSIPGEKVFTIGVQVTQADLAAPGVGNNPPLVVQSLTFTGGPNGALHQSGSSNEPNIQAVQTDFIDPAAVGGPPTTLSAAGEDALYRDSWWYSSGSINDPVNSGTLKGVINSSGGIGVVTTNPAGDGSGVYTIGPTNNVGATGYVFQEIPPGTTPANPTSGQTMAYSGILGPFGANGLTAAPLAGQFVGGVLTVPVAQIVASGNIAIPSQYDAGAGTFLEVGQTIYNVLGGPVGTDPGAFLDYNSNVIRAPEPSTFVLASIALLAIAAKGRSRRRR
jgi:hypothetical protein